MREHQDNFCIQIASPLFIARHQFITNRIWAIRLQGRIRQPRTFHFKHCIVQFNFDQGIAITWTKWAEIRSPVGLRIFQDGFCHASTITLQKHISQHHHHKTNKFTLKIKNNNKKKLSISGLLPKGQRSPSLDETSYRSLFFLLFFLNI